MVPLLAKQQTELGGESAWTGGWSILPLPPAFAGGVPTRTGAGALSNSARPAPGVSGQGFEAGDARTLPGETAFVHEAQLTVMDLKDE